MLSTQDINLVYGSFILILTIFCFLTIFTPYAFLALWPATFASSLVETFGGVFSKKDPHLSFVWTLIDKVKQSRQIAITGLIIILCGLGFIDLVFFFSLSLGGKIPFYLLFLAPVFIFFYYLAELLNYGKITIDKGDHQRATELRHDLENVAIASGVQAPNFQILTNLNPTSFTISPNFGQPCVFVTTGLLNLANKTDLEAVCAYEIGNIVSKKVFDYKLINNLLALMRGFSYILFILLLANFNLLWIYLICLVFIFIRFAPLMLTSIGLTSGADLLVRITNPPYVLTNFFAYIIYYSTCYDEVYLADLKTIQLTRYPAGLYSILTKIASFDEENEPMPSDYFYLYFTAETNWDLDISAPQPPIANRIALLDKLDTTLKNLTFEKEVKELLCPFCASPLSEFCEESHYGIAVKIHFCQKCGSAWFDKWELFNIAHLKMPLLTNQNFQNIPIPPKFLCPKCGVELLLWGDVNIPVSVHVWRCPSCDGNWLEHEDLVEYETFKENSLKAKNI